jgi:hypothetical protein
MQQNQQQNQKMDSQIPPVSVLAHQIQQPKIEQSVPPLGVGLKTERTSDLLDASEDKRLLMLLGATVAVLLAVKSTHYVWGFLKPKQVVGLKLADLVLTKEEQEKQWFLVQVRGVVKLINERFPRLNVTEKTFINPSGDLVRECTCPALDVAQCVKDGGHARGEELWNIWHCVNYFAKDLLYSDALKKYLIETAKLFVVGVPATGAVDVWAEKSTNFFGFDNTESTQETPDFTYQKRTAEQIEKDRKTLNDKKAIIAKTLLAKNLATLVTRKISEKFPGLKNISEEIFYDKETGLFTPKCLCPGLDAFLCLTNGGHIRYDEKGGEFWNILHCTSFFGMDHEGNACLEHNENKASKGGKLERDGKTTGQTELWTKKTTSFFGSDTTETVQEQPDFVHKGRTPQRIAEDLVKFYEFKPKKVDPIVSSPIKDEKPIEKKIEEKKDLNTL